jgi:hypothetical protein
MVKMTERQCYSIARRAPCDRGVIGARVQKRAFNDAKVDVWNEVFPRRLGMSGKDTEFSRSSGTIEQQ